MGIGENTGENVAENTGTIGGSSFLAPPTVFNIVDNTQTQNRVDVTWTPPAKGGATEYIVKNSSIGTILGTVTWPATGMTVTGLAADTTYTMHVVTSDGSAESSASNSDTITTNPVSATGEPAVYTRFMNWESYNPGDIAIGSNGNLVSLPNTDANFDTHSSLFGAETGRCVVVDDIVAKGTRAVRFRGENSINMGAGPGIVVSPNRTATQWTKGTEIWLQYNIRVNQEFIDQGGANNWTSDGAGGSCGGTKWNRFATNISGGGWYPSFYWWGGQSPSSNSLHITTESTTTTYRMSVPGHPTNGAMVADTWYKLEVNVLFGDANTPGRWRVWVDDLPAYGNGEAGYTSGYDMISPTLPTDSGVWHTGHISFFGQWNWCLNDTVYAWADNIVVCVNGGADGYTDIPANVDSRGSPFIGDWDTPAPTSFSPSLFSIDNTKYTLGETWGPGTGGGYLVDGYWNNTDGWSLGRAESVLTIVSNPTWPTPHSFTTPPSGGKCLEHWARYCSWCTGTGSDQAIGLQIGPSTLGADGGTRGHNLEGVTMMFQARIYDPAGYNYGNEGIEDARKMFRINMRQGDGSGGADWLMAMEHPNGVDSINGAASGGWHMEKLTEGSPNLWSGYAKPWPTYLDPSQTVVASTPVPADRWNTYHIEIYNTVSTNGYVKVWINQQLMFNWTGIATLLNTTDYLTNVHWIDPWNSGQRQDQAQYYDDWIFHRYDINGAWPFGNQFSGAPDLITGAIVI